MNLNHDIQNVILEFAKKQPSKTAIEFGNIAISYYELNKQISSLSDILKDNGVTKGSIVAICIPDSIELIISIFAVLYLRAIVLPINTELPLERIEKIFFDSQPKIALCKKEWQNEIARLNVKSLAIDSVYLKRDISEDNCFAIDITENDNAFCIYTSGSTGVPKGVLLNYKGILNHAEAKIELLNITQDSKICLSFNIGFVASIWQILVPILMGAILVLYDKDLIRKPYHFFKQIEKDRLSMISMTPHTLSAYVKYITFGKYKLPLQELKFIVLTGEKINDKLVLKFYELYEHITLINAYGQTECSDDTYHYIIPRSIKLGNIPIGKPIKNIYGFILNEDLKEVEFGELYIGGIGVAQGYLHNQELTNSKFIKLPIYDGLLYKTGDLVKKNDNGDLVYIGRIDNQVKIRGYRVELEEVENNINNFQGIIETVVRTVDLNEEDKILEALYVGTKIIDKKELREFLINRLPGYMVPVKFTQVKSFSYTPNGKIDRNNIDISAAINYDAEKSKVELSELQKKIFYTIMTNIDEAVFPDITIDTDLTGIGLDSITFIKIVVSLEEVFDFEFDDEMLLFTVFPTFRSMIKYVESKISKNTSVSDGTLTVM